MGLHITGNGTAPSQYAPPRITPCFQLAVPVPGGYGSAIGRVRPIAQIIGLAAAKCLERPLDRPTE
jgi:hypothetical protein